MGGLEPTAARLLTRECTRANHPKTARAVTVEAGFNDDFLDMLRALVESNVEFVVVGAHAMAVHGVPRATGDLDVLVRPSPRNAAKLWDALLRFGAPVEAHGVRSEDFIEPGAVYQIGLPPCRIDVLTSISGLTFDQAWESALRVPVQDLEIPFLGRDALIANKRAAARDKDLVDVRLLTADRDRARERDR